MQDEKCDEKDVLHCLDLQKAKTVVRAMLARANSEIEAQGWREASKSEQETVALVHMLKEGGVKYHL